MKQNGKVYNNAIFLDRDGVLNKCININRKCFAPTTFNKFRLYPYVISSIKKLKEKNFLIIVVTNQPDINKKKIKLEEINKMNKKLIDIGIDDIFICPHAQESKCSCRKPKVGLITRVKKKYNINFKNSYFIGDRKSDMELAKKINCTPLFINRYYLENQNYNANYSFYSLNGAVKYILNK